MLRAVLLSRPKPLQAGAEGQPLQGHSSAATIVHQGHWAAPCRCLNPWPSGRIDRLGVRNSSSQNSTNFSWKLNLAHQCRGCQRLTTMVAEKVTAL
jgi:hypothetical protein